MSSEVVRVSLGYRGDSRYVNDLFNVLSSFVFD